MVLLSLASRQIWPQILVISHLKPKKVYFLHSEDKIESKSPAQRLKRFFDDSELIQKGMVKMFQISHEDFSGVVKSLDALLTDENLSKEECVINITGGNKLMVVAAFYWAEKNNVNCLYLERGNLLISFKHNENSLQTETEKLDGHITDHFEPIPLLRCHLETSEIESEGQTITLKETANKENEEKFFRMLKNGNDMDEFLHIQPTDNVEKKKGDRLEFAVAALVLKLGVKKVHRGIRLKVKSENHISTKNPHSEIDLFFNWNGKLWIVDCKDRIPPTDFVARLRRMMIDPNLPETKSILSRITSQLSISQTKEIKEDLVAIRETGGLMGQVVCVRKSQMSEEVLQFAKLNRIAVILKSNMVEEFKKLISPPENECRNLNINFSKKECEPENQPAS